QNLESQRLQYELAERIRSLGWRHVEIVDSDLGPVPEWRRRSEKASNVYSSSVTLGEVGIVGSRHASRLSRTNKGVYQSRLHQSRLHQNPHWPRSVWSDPAKSSCALRSPGADAGARLVFWCLVVRKRTTPRVFALEP